MRLYQTFLYANSAKCRNFIQLATNVSSANFRYFNSSSIERAAPAGGILKGKKGPTLEKIKLPVETDPERLVKYCCGSDYKKEDSQDAEIKPDPEYPDWLWTIRLERATPLEDMEPTTKAYWRRTKAYYKRYYAGLKKLRRF